MRGKTKNVLEEPQQVYADIAVLNEMKRKENEIEPMAEQISKQAQ